jgi:hypothetical protein
MGSLNQSAIAAYKKQLSRQAMAWEFLIPYVTYFAVTTMENIKLQSSTLAQLTQATNHMDDVNGLCR